MTTALERAQLAALYQCNSAELLQNLPDIAGRIESQFAELLRVTTPERAERLALELDGVSRYLRTIREAMLREATPPGAAA